MKWKPANPQTLLNLVAAGIMVIGLASAVLIYLTAGDVPDTILGYDVDESKKYMHDLELYGGKVNVLAVEFMKWFDGLWHGRTLAFTVGFITLVISLGLAFVAYHMTTDSKFVDREEDDRG
jgi:hypothetical protein